ncbi:MAK10-like protein [Tanacetum coccineum]
MTYDLSLGVVKFTKGVEEIAYKMPHKIEQYDSLLDREKENMKKVYFRNEDDKRKGVEYVMSKMLGFYKECLELGPEYRTGLEENGSNGNQGGFTCCLEPNPIRTLGDYSRPSHEGYRNTIELPEGNNVVPLRSDTIRLVQNGCSFHRLRSKDPNQHLKDFLKLMDSLDLDVVNRERTRLCLFQFSFRDQASNWLERLPTGSISTWEDLTTHFLAQFFPPGRTAKLCGKLRDRIVEESWALLEDLALYDSESWNDPRDFTKPVKAISLPQDVLITFDRRQSNA